MYTRGWNEEEVDAAYERLSSRGLVAGDALTAAGTELRDHIEQTTDLATGAIFDRLGDDADELIALLDPWAEAIVAGGGYPASPKNLQVSG